MRRILVLFFAYLATPIVKANDPLCAGLPEDQEVLFPSPISCTHYYRCYNGVFSEERCPDGLYFSSNNNGCVEAQFAECLGGSGGPSTTTEYTTASTTPEVVDTIVPSTTTTPQTTTTEEPTISTTPPPGPSTTTPPSVSPTPITTTSPDVPTTPSHVDPRCEGGEISYWPHPSECSLYIECYRGDSYEMACPPNRYFSDSHKRCVEASESDCCAQNPSKCSQ